MNLVRYSPRTMDLFDWNRVFERFFDSDPVVDTRTPAVDIIEDDKGYRMAIELPGLTEKEIELKVENSVLTVSSKKEEEKEEEKRDYVLKERRSYSFCRSFTLPKNITSDKIEASFKNGILSIFLPKAPEAKPKMIEVKSK
jgi:HSP20 family protein